jgi:hypothetical protein
VSTDLQKPSHAEHDGYVALSRSPAEVHDIIAANLGGQPLSPFDLPRVRIPGSGGTTWEIPSLEGDRPAQTIEGIVIHFKLIRSYWPGDFQGSQPPQCSSPDNRIGIGDPGGLCEECPFSQFGSDKSGRGQACKQMEQWFVIVEDSLLPLVLTLPPKSLASARKYRLNLTNSMLQLNQVVTRLTLATDTNADGIKYAYAVPRLAERLNPNEADRARAYAESIREVLDRAPVTTPSGTEDTDA